jgi:chromosome segregation ATPase
VIGLPTVALGYLGYRRSQKLDRVASAASLAASQSSETKTVIEGLNSIIENLQKDNRVQREENVLLRKEWREEVAQVRKESATATAKCEELAEKYALLEKRLVDIDKAVNGV